MVSLMEEFGTFCSELQISSLVFERTNQFFQDILPIYSKCRQSISRKALFACSVFLAVQDTHFSLLSKLDTNDLKPEITVSQLLEKAEINIMDFFNVTGILKKNYPLSENIKHNLIALERKYLIVSALYDKFESMVGEIFFSESDANQQLSPNIGSNPNRQGSRELLKGHKTLCWMLFLVAKAKVLWHRQELLATFHLLLCCIGEVMRMTPAFLLLPPFDSSVLRSESSLSFLELLSNHFNTKFEEVKLVYDGWLHVVNELNIGSKLPEISDLHSMYKDIYIQNGDLDESLFLIKDWHLLPSGTGQSGSPQKSQLASVRRTLDTAEALNTILTSTSNDFTPFIKSCLRRCPPDTSVSIKNFLLRARSTFIEAFIEAQEGGNKNLAERRFEMASRYYYLMLDALLQKEADRLSPAAFASFLRNDVFHKSLLACCLEVTLMSCGFVGSVTFTPLQHEENHRAQGISFPWILDVFGLEAFNFFKIVESFILKAPSITMQIINHLKNLEHQILESLAWRSGSSLFELLAKTRPKPSSSAYWSPNKDPSQRVPATPHTPHAVNIFLNKVCRLAYQRFEKLCSFLHIEKDTQTDIWACIELVLYRKNLLLQNRHIDQIILCCIFAVCKAKDKEVPFKSILAAYDQLPHSSVSIYKQVLSNGKKGHIFKFYNFEFHAEMKAFVVNQFADKTKASSSSMDISKSPATSPFYSVTSRKNIFVSPLQPSSSFKNPNEIIYRKLPSYTFGSLTQSTKMLQDINASLNTTPTAVREVTEARGKKRLLFESEEEEQNKQVMFASARKFLKFDEPDNSSSGFKFKTFSAKIK